MTLNVGQACCFLSHPLLRCVPIGQAPWSWHHCFTCSVHLVTLCTSQGPPQRVPPPWSIFWCSNKTWYHLCLHFPTAGCLLPFIRFICGPCLLPLLEDMSCISLVIKCPGASSTKLGMEQGLEFHTHMKHSELERRSGSLCVNLTFQMGRKSKPERARCFIVVNIQLLPESAQNLGSLDLQGSHHSTDDVDWTSKSLRSINPSHSGRCSLWIPRLSGRTLTHLRVGGYYHAPC